MKFLSPTECCTLLGEIETQFDVQSWTVNGLDVWPIYRMAIHSEARVRQYTQWRWARSYRAFEHARRLLQVLPATASLKKTVQNPNSADFVFLGYSPVGTMLNGICVDRLIDPLVEAALDNGHSVLSLDRGSVSQPRLHPVKSVQSWQDLAFLVAYAKTSSSRAYDLPDFDRVEHFLSLRGVVSPRLRLTGILHSVRRIEFMSRLFKRILEEARPRAVFCVNASTATAMSMTLASKQLAIPMVEIQHGVLAGNAVYGPWERVPAEGYTLLPNFYWVWAETDRSVIAPLSTASGGKHRAVVGGHPFVSYWHQNAGSYSSQRSNQWNLLSDPSRFHIVVTLGAESLSNCAWKDCLEVFRQSPGDWQWWVRAHPLDAAAGRLCGVGEAIRNLQLPNVEFKFATSAPLYLLFEQAQAHVTTLSTSTIEAAQFGVPTVLIEPEAKVLFRAVFDHGEASLALTPEQLLQSLRVIQARGKRPARSSVQPPLISTIRSILVQ